MDGLFDTGGNKVTNLDEGDIAALFAPIES